MGNIMGELLGVSIVNTTEKTHHIKPQDDSVNLIYKGAVITQNGMVYFLIGHYTYRIVPPAIDIIPTSLAVVYSNGKYTNYKN